MIDYIKIAGFKSIREMELELMPINLFIGSNGSGKSNFIAFFKLLNAIFNSRLQKYIMEEKTDNILYFGRKHTEILSGKVIFSEDEINNNAYFFYLAQTKEGGLFLEKEGSGYNVSTDNEILNYFQNDYLDESKFAKSNFNRDVFLRNYISNLQIFHFHDTSATSLLRGESDINDNRYLKQDGRNLAAFLHLLKEKYPKNYARILKTIQSIAPYIDNFILEPNRLNEQQIALRWIDKGDSESNFSAYQLSDGTLRFIALATLLMQPEPPAIIIIDEPELGLHPFAIVKLAGMIQSVSTKSQIIAATQSPSLISHFSPENVVVIDKSQSENQSIFRRLNTDSLKNWLQDYSLGDLWERNILNAAQPFMK
jgi:predicted ATPase